MINTYIDQRPLARYPLTVENIEFGLFERRRHLVLDDLDLCPVPDGLTGVLQGLDPAHIQPNGGVELESFTPCGRLRTPEHHTNFLPELVDEDRGRTGIVQCSGDLAERLTHESGLQTHVRVPHLSLDLGARNQRRHR